MNRQMIEIDIDVHKAIEARRFSFNESKNDILRREFGVAQVPRAPVQSPDSHPSIREKRQRRSGQYTVFWAGGEAAGTSLKDILKRTILAFEKKSPGFIDILARHRTSVIAHVPFRRDGCG